MEKQKLGKGMVDPPLVDTILVGSPIINTILVDGALIGSVLGSKPVCGRFLGDGPLGKTFMVSHYLADNGLFGGGIGSNDRERVTSEDAPELS